MHILAMTPIWVSEEELARRQARYDRFSPEGVTIRLQLPGSGSDIPRALETAADVAASEEALVRRFEQEDGAGVDAFLSDCVLDPVVDHPTARLARPIYGIVKLTSHFLASQGLALGAVARNRAIADELDRKLSGYGLAAAGTTEVLGLSVEDIADDDTWAAATDAMLAKTSAEAVINGCSAVEVHPLAGGPALIDPTAMALRLLGVMAAVQESR
jgi:Asp/Glu/hydantoin racemase